MKVKVHSIRYCQRLEAEPFVQHLKGAPLARCLDADAPVVPGDQAKVGHDILRPCHDPVPGDPIKPEGSLLEAGHPGEHDRLLGAFNLPRQKETFVNLPGHGDRGLPVPHQGSQALELLEVSRGERGRGEIAKHSQHWPTILIHFNHVE